MQPQNEVQPGSDHEFDNNPNHPTYIQEIEEDTIRRCVAAGMQRTEICSHLEGMGITTSRTTLTRRLKQYGLSTSYNKFSPQDKSVIQAHLAKFNKLGYQRKEAITQIMGDTGILINMYDLRTISEELSISWQKDDIQQGLVVPEDLLEQMKFIVAGSHRNTGYRRMQNALAVIHNIRVNRDTVRSLLHQIDPEGVEARRRGTLKRRAFHVDGPNHVWSTDGHDKLKPYGITVYGFIDAWSRKALGLYAGVKNNDPRRIGYHYLDVVEKIGGIPQKTCTDHGTETIKMAGFQMSLVQIYGGFTPDEAEAAHLYTTSQRNQKIESLWSLIRKAFGINIHDEIEEGVKRGIYKECDPLHYMLFLHLWVPIVQELLDRYTAMKNSARTRKNKNSGLPTSVIPDVIFSSPEKYNAVEGLIPVPKETIQTLRERHFPDAELLFQVSPKRFEQQVDSVL